MADFNHLRRRAHAMKTLYTVPLSSGKIKADFWAMLLHGRCLLLCGPYYEPLAWFTALYIDTHYTHHICHFAMVALLMLLQRLQDVDTIQYSK